MAERKSKYLPIAADDELRERIAQIAEAERRSVAEQGRFLLEVGLEEYERRERRRQEILSGQTQLDVSALDVESRR